LNEEKIDVRGYFHWALTDNYEWVHGFKMKFGLFAVDLKTKKRIMRKSAKIYKKIVETNT
ncbi:MAG: family 1 glycosylhydrolase, partial [Candidatus Bathycorpusculaceae bacterium]